jgi:glycosyltransferase involved in cell wall biosynthesis
MENKKKWYTLTPKHFIADEAFFSRDAGLLAKGFRDAGYESKLIMPLPWTDKDLDEYLIRTDYKNLKDPEWWRSLNCEGVVLYGWGMGKYLPIVKAIKKADIFLISHLDTSGLLSILNGWEFARALKYSNLYDAPYINKLMMTGLKLSYHATIGLIKNDITRALHFKHADVLGAVSPIALERIKKVCRYYGGANIYNKLKLIPHPVADYHKYDGSVKKEKLIVAVGRWDAKKKGPDLLKKVIQNITAMDGQVNVEIYGKYENDMVEWYKNLPVQQRKRVFLKGFVLNNVLSQAYKRAIISLCTSVSEGYHTASAEALCCGASVVGPDIFTIPNMKWYTEGPFGRIAMRDEQSLSQALLQELEAWQNGERDPVFISDYWAEKLHLKKIIQNMVNFKNNKF